MKKKLQYLIALLSIMVLLACTNDKDARKGITQLENMGYTNIQLTGYEDFCCSDSDDFSTGFTARDKNGVLVKGCICSGFLKGITIRFE